MTYERPTIESLGDAQMSEVMGAFANLGIAWFTTGLAIGGFIPVPFVSLIVGVML